jgi:hypothetical protein
VWPKRPTHTKHELRSSVSPTSYIQDYSVSHFIIFSGGYVQLDSQLPPHCPITGQYPCLSSRTGARNKSSSLSPSAGKTLLQCPVLVTEPALRLSLYVRPRHPQGHLLSDRLVNRTLPSELNLMECRINMCSTSFRYPRAWKHSKLCSYTISELLCIGALHNL